MIFRSRCALALALAAASFTPNAALAFDRVQPPDLAVGQRATLGGSLANTSYSPSDVSRGGFTLPSPFTAPDVRGATQAQVFPQYSPDNGISAWGMGFSTNLQLTRWRVSGSLQYDFTKGDEMISPFGHLTKGADGNWYPVGLDKPVRVVAGANDTFLAYQPDGSVWTFGGTARVTNANGTYAWHLTQVRDAIGHLTTLTWTANASGNLFLTEVDYGGRATPQYRITYAYEGVNITDAAGNTLPKFVDYRSGAPLALDQRVTTVTIQSRDAQSGVFAERWHYTLSYVGESVGAAFYLARIDQTFASGESSPPVLYTYNLKGASYATTQLTEVPQLTQLLTTLGVTEDALQPSRAAVTDIDADGNSDLELGDNARTLLSQKGSGTADDPLRYEVSTIPASPLPACLVDGQTNCVFDGCLPLVNDGTVGSPRMLSQLNPTDTSVNVLHFLYDSSADETSISQCTRDGVRTSVQTVPTQWDESELVRFVDLNADHMPDLVRVAYGRYDIVPNTSAVSEGQTQVAWGSGFSGTLGDTDGYPMVPENIWVSDMSGDGVPDLVGLYGDAIEVWHGLGNYQFLPTAQELRFFDRDGYPFTGLAGFKMVPADLNKDGLQDYFVTNSDSSSSRSVLYFTNVGGKYVETPVAALDAISPSASVPIIATLDGTGNLAVTLTDTGKAYSVALDGPETGLMATADDGKGTVLSFSYARGPASPGVRHRSVLLAGMQVQASGYDTMSYDYRYDQPTVHTIGHFLVGYGDVVRREGDLPSAPLGQNDMSFLNGDNWSGVMVSGRETDGRLPDVAKVESRTYTDEMFQGIPYKRLASSASGWVSADGTAQAVDVTTYDSYANDFCASHTTLRSSSHGTLATQTDRANPAALVNNLHCLEGHVVQTGTHADASFDFRQEQTVARNDQGRVTQVTVQGGAGPLVQQVVGYDPDIDPISITVPGKGTTTISYDPATKLPSTVVTPDGVTSRVVRDSRTDATTDVLIDRGGIRWNDFASYDGQERLASRWSDLDASSAVAPHERYAYSYASANHPGTVGIETLVDAATGAYRDTTELYTAADEKIGTASLNDAGWVVDGFVARSRAHAEEDHYEVATQPTATQFAAIDYATLLQGTPDRISTQTKTTLGPEAATTNRLHPDVTKATSTTVTVDGSGRLAHTTLVNGANATTSFTDPTGKLTLGYIDEAKTAYVYAYDALGRLRAVSLPDGAQHRVTYDEYGRESSIRRDGVALVTNAYAPLASGTSDLLASRTFAPAPTDGTSPAPLRAIAFTYDSIGRKQVEAHSDATAADTRVFTYFYDGATPGAPVPPVAALGLLTAVTGQGYTKTFVYRADGKPLHRALAIDGFRTVATDFAYREDGTAKDQTVTVTDPSGAVQTTSAHHQAVDAFGRPSVVAVNGATLATTAYDPLGRPATASFTTGDSVAFAYDPLTRQGIGFDQTRAGGVWGGVASTRVKQNDRGFVGTEVLGVGPASVLRTYSYSPQGFLTGANDGALP